MSKTFFGFQPVDELICRAEMFAYGDGASFGSMQRAVSVQVFGLERAFEEAKFTFGKFAFGLDGIIEIAHP